MPTNSENGTRRIPLLEWVAAAIGLVILLSMFAFLTMEVLKTDEKEQPSFGVEPVSVSQSAGHYVVEVRVSNRSGQTGAGVQIEGALRQAGRDVEKSSATLDYVPGHSERHAGLIFTRDPRMYQVDLRATGYQRP